MKSREIEAVLKRYGFERGVRCVARSLYNHVVELISQKGSHRKWRNSELGLQVIVPEHKGKDLPTGTLKNILKGAQIPKSEWRK
jgi:predicted RNA binding protein YcfA (HicA-like mRNA interferase family)